MSVRAKIIECGNGLADVGDYVAGDDGEVYTVTAFASRIQTGQPGQGNWMYADLELADWSDVEDQSEPACRAMIMRAERCNHEDWQSGEAHGFGGSSVASDEERSNRAAHGGVSYNQVCTACGAVRSVNQNGRHFEFGPWRLEAL